MAREHTFVDEVYPKHWTTSGRRAACQRFTSPGFIADPMMKHLKIVDPDLIGADAKDLGVHDVNCWIGYGRWLIKEKGQESPVLSSEAEGNWWESDRDKLFVEWLQKAYLAARQEKLNSTSKHEAIFCECLHTYEHLA
ncbi:MAG: hypothetical protein Q9162_002887 [Coniocarpon cinnabarinum]